MPIPGEPENGARAPEVPLTLQLAKESQLMIRKLKELKLDDPSVPGMAVFGENGSQIAILLGKTVQKPTAGQEQTGIEEKHLVVSPKGIFLAEGHSDVAVSNNDTLSSTLNNIRKKEQDLTNVSIDDKGRLAISTRGASGMFQSFNMTKIDANPEQFAQMLKSAVENSRKIAQKPLKDDMERVKAGSSMLDVMIQEERSQMPTSNPSQMPPSSQAA